MQIQTHHELLGNDCVADLSNAPRLLALENYFEEFWLFISAIVPCAITTLLLNWKQTKFLIKSHCTIKTQNFQH